MRNYFLILGFSLLSCASFAQQNKVYRSIKEANKNPEQVYQLNLSVDAPFDKEGTLDELLYFNALAGEEEDEKAVRARVDSMAKAHEASITRLDKFPEDIAQYKNLRTLNICFHNITEVPAYIYELKSLELLDIEGNKVVNISNDIGQLQQLQLINFAENKIETLPAAISELQQLKELNLSFNPLTSLNFITKDIPSLTNISCINAEISDISPVLKLSKLKNLYLGNNNIKSIPATFYTNLKTLERIDLSSNGISTISDDIQKLEQLEYIDLAYNKIKTIPALYELKKLNTLYLTKNLIDKIPSHFYKLSSDVYIFLIDNPLKEKTLKKLTEKFPYVTIVEEGC